METCHMAEHYRERYYVAPTGFPQNAKYYEFLNIFQVLSKVNCSLMILSSGNRSRTNCGDNRQLQNDLHSLEHWSEKWLLKFNTEICHKMSIGHNLLTAYYMTDVNGAKQVEKVAEEKDLGILITDEMK